MLLLRECHEVIGAREDDGVAVIEAAQLTTWLASYDTIMASYAKAYSNSFKTISITDALKLAGGT